MNNQVKVETSARHVHLTQEQVELLFGAGHELTPKKMLSQPGQFLSEERVTLVGPKRKLERVGVLGPVRGKAQVELSLTDCFGIGIKTAQVRESGHTKDTVGITLETEKASLTLEEGVIVAKRHVHMTNKDAEEFGVENGQIVSVEVKNDSRSLVYGDVVVRVSNSYALAMHIDTDEANAALLHGEVMGTLIK